jgi:hypothetical protein
LMMSIMEWNMHFRISIRALLGLNQMLSLN